MGEPGAVVAGSNGVSVALRLAIDHPRLVTRLLLLWPATGGDASIDVSIPAEAAHLLEGDTVRGVSDVELARLTIPVAVMASSPETPFHRLHTVERLVRCLPAGRRIDPSFPESPRPEFQHVIHDFIDTVVDWLSTPVTDVASPRPAPHRPQ